MGSRSAKRYFIVAGSSLLFILFLYHINSSCDEYGPSAVMVSPEKYMIGSNAAKYTYDNNMPLIFIGGMPRSGTTLLRVLLDAHPDIRCGEETRVIPRLLGMKQQWVKAPIEARRLQEAGITGKVLDAAVGSFILEVIARHGEPAPRLCNKDPFTLRSAVYLHSLFPNAKFILMIRDGRAVVHSIINRKVTISGFDLSDFRQCMKKWNTAMQAMFNQCQQLGPTLCLPVYYEQLVLHPKPWLEQILSFLKVPWNESVLHHDQLVNKPGGISLSKLERSTDQVIKPINLQALTKWVGHIPEDVVRDMANIAPMLSFLGYDPNLNPPDYGKPDSFVIRNNKIIEDNKMMWEERERELTEHREAVRKALKTKTGEESKTKRTGQNVQLEKPYKEDKV